MQPEALRLEVRLLRQEVSDLHADVGVLLARLLARDDRRIGMALLPLGEEVFDGEPFTAARLADRALNDRTARGEALRDLIADVLGDREELRPLGEFLARIEGVRLGGVRLIADGHLHGVRRYRLVRGNGAV